MLIEAHLEIRSEMGLSQFFLFCCVGGVGFFVDLSMSLLLINVCGLHPLGARIVSWFFAATFTFFLNTALAFQVISFVTRTRSHFLRAYAGYLFSQSLGGSVNILTFMLISIFLGKGVTAGIVFGAMLGLVVNYLGASKVLVQGKNGA